MVYNEYGKGVATDMTQAAYWYQKASEQGHAAAQYHLGFCYGRGEGVPMDENKAIYWLKQSAANGDEDAQANLKEWGISW